MQNQNFKHNENDVIHENGQVKDVIEQFLADIDLDVTLSSEDCEALLEQVRLENLAETLEPTPNDFDAEGNPIFIPENENFENFNSQNSQNDLQESQKEAKSKGKTLAQGALCALMSVFLIACGGGIDNEFLPKSPLEKKDFESPSIETIEQKYSSKNAWDKDYKSIVEKCSYMKYARQFYQGLSFVGRDPQKISRFKEYLAKEYPNGDFYNIERNCDTLENFARNKGYIEQNEKLAKENAKYEKIFSEMREQYKK